MPPRWARLPAAPRSSRFSSAEVIRKNAAANAAQQAIRHEPSATPQTASSSHTPPSGRQAVRIVRKDLSWTAGLSRPTLAGLLLAILTLFHLVGLYTFTRGFLLTRLAIPAVSPPYTSEAGPPMPPTHSKAVIIIIDALRTDFLSPYHPSAASSNHHGVLTLPAELTARRPDHSLIFNTYSDPPTATMQRIKGITTGSLPTFIDMGANFASTAIEEDSLISQLVAANKSVVFMGDDTWTNLFPSSFAFSHPYDSFNVEDLHTVDNGVIEHIFPYLQPANSSKWDVLIGHFLGVDHVGHRVGPYATTMREKLLQMDEVLRRVVDMLDDDTLLVVLGDHGMDDKGNHGGDSELEVAAALWLYSKGPALTGMKAGAAASLTASFPRYTFPGSATTLRHINQIDIVPTLSLLLGLPIPFNNLGSVIPECFLTDSATLEAAMRANVEQINRYIAEYGDTKVSHGLNAVNNARNEAIDHLQSACKVSGASDIMCSSKTPADALLKSYAAHKAYADAALTLFRGLWAQFSIALICLGLAILALNIPVLLLLYTGIRNRGPAWDDIARSSIEVMVRVGAQAGGVVGLALTPFKLREPAFIAHAAAIAGVLGAEITLSFAYLTSIPQPRLASISLQRGIGPALLIIHALSFASNSFIMWEDRVVVYLINTVTLVYLVKALTHPTASMRLKVIALSLAFGLLIRLLGNITVCREEQQPYCQVTFFAGSTAVPPTWVLMAIVPLGLQLPRLIAMVLHQSKSMGGPAHTFLGVLWRATLAFNAIQWVLEYAESIDYFVGERSVLAKIVRTWSARASFFSTFIILPYYWLTSALCITVERGTEQDGSEKPVTVLGFANAYGSTYLLFLLIPFGLFHLVSPPMAQVALAVMLCVLLAHLENVDTHRDSILMIRHFSQSPSGSAGAFEPDSGPSGALVRPSFTDLVPLALLGFIGFFSTGHQAVLTTIQWKAAFVGFERLTYPWSPLLVILNTWGPFLLTALAVPLLAIWNVSPRPSGTIPVLAHAMQLAIGFMIYHTITTFASALCAAWLRRHLMVWKVFAPRFMLSGVTLLSVDLGLILGITVGLRVTSWKVWRTFKCESI